MTGDEFKKIRLENSLTQRALSETLKVTVASVSNWERGRTPISPFVSNVMCRLVSILDS